MAATGGGKIRSRRYHIASKPYAKSKQQQPGLISRVTDTVRSIVPSWLQKYFRNGEAAEGGGASPGAGQNNQAPPPNGSEEVAPPHDGRDSPEPSTSNTEPSTSRASLNFQDHVLSRPPLNRSHLHFPSLDASTALGGGGGGGGAALFSQPSTSGHAHPPFPGTAFATGTASSSGFSLVKEIKDSSSQHEDDNISTTSGFSSRASEKDVPTSKTASLPQLWSPETDRTHSGPQPAQSSLKKPAFNLSVFGTSSTSTMNSSGLSSSQLGDSPFYPGKTTYGGAAAVRTARARPATPYQAPMRRQMKAKPAGAQPCGVTSATARRILQSLERMSSPLADAKRIPSAASSHQSTSPYGAILERSHLQGKRKRQDSPLPPVQKLVIPTAASSAGNRSMSFRASLTPAGLGRPLTPRDQPARQSPEVPEVVAGPSESTSSLPYPLSTSTPAASSTGSGGGKMKRDRTSTRQSNKRPDDEVAEVLDLPAISLPISTFSLPTFSFSSPPPATPVMSTVTPVATELVTSKDPLTTSPGPCVPFTFASPIVMATAASPPSFSPTAGFTFSAPVAKTGPSVSNGKMAAPTLAAKCSANEETEEFEGLFKPAKVLKQGSVLDLLKAPGFASPARSSPDPAPDPAPAVSTAPSSSSSSSSSGFGDLFKPPAGSWSCDVCMVQNKPTDAKCVACQSPQPNTDSSSSSTPSDSKPPATAASRLESTTTAPTPVGFGTLFATPAGTWDCDTCLVQNKPEAVKCVACQTLKPGSAVKPSPTLSTFSGANALAATAPASAPASSGFAGFGDRFKKPEGAWECDTCMVENSAHDSKCVACMSAKPGAASASLPPAPAPACPTPLLGFGDKFKKAEGSWECDTCCVQNKAAELQCVACQTTRPGAKVEPKALGSSSFGVSSNSVSGGFKFGTSSSLSDSTSGTGGFKFGATPSDSTSSGGFKFGVSSSSSSGGFKFGGGLSETTFNDTGFKFGVASSTTTASDDDKNAEPATMGVGFKFGGANTPSSTESKPSEGGFSFGLAKPEETTTTSFSSSFSVPAAPQEKSEKDNVFSVDSTSTTTAAASLFGGLAGAEPALTSAPLGGATFGAAVAASAEKESPAPSFTFGKPEEKEPSVTSGFLFGAAGKEVEGSSAPSVGFSFSKPDPPKEPAQPSFTFGKPADKSETPTEAPKAFSFGQSAPDAAAPAPVFGFMASSSSSTTSSSSSTTPAPSLFGTPSSSAAAPSTTFMFGQGSSSDAPPAKTFLFGQNQGQDSQPAPVAAPSLTATPAPPPAPAPAQPFLFGSAASTAAPAVQSSFTFGTAAPPAASTTAPPPSAGPSPFVFSSASSAGFGSGQAPTFGQVSSQPSAPAFGSPAPSPFMAASSQPPAFGATSVFGAAANSTSGGGFQFGGAGAFGAASSSPGVFSFGGAPPGTPAPSAPPSITPQPSAPGGGFNFAQPPAFNMGSAKNNFTASPAGQNTIAGRKIKTAVRRRK